MGQKVECGRTHKFIFCGIQWGMAYYGYEGAYRRRRYHRPVKIRKFAVIAAILAAVIGVIVYFQSRVADLLWELSESTVYSRSAEALNSAAMQALQWNGVSYDDLVIITRDGENNVLSIEVDTRAVNLAARQTVSLASAALNEVCEQGVKVPIGAFTGIELLSGFGPKVTFRTLPVGTVTCQLSSQFRSAGINQTAHSVYLLVSAQVRIVLPSGTREVQAQTPVLICESIIVGKIPDVYLQGGKT